MINPACDCCGEELQVPGALLFSHPNLGWTRKWHICINCEPTILSRVGKNGPSIERLQRVMLASYSHHCDCMEFCERFPPEKGKILMKTCNRGELTLAQRALQDEDFPDDDDS